MGHRAQFIGSLPQPIKQQAGQHYDRYMAQHAGDPARQAFAQTLPDVLTYGGGAAFLAALARRGLYRTPKQAAKSKLIVGSVGIAAALIAAAYHTPALQDAKRQQRRDVQQHVMNSLIQKHADEQPPVQTPQQTKRRHMKNTNNGAGVPTVPQIPTPSIGQSLFTHFGGTGVAPTIGRGAIGYALARMFGGGNLLAGMTAATAAAAPWVVPHWQRVHRFVTQSAQQNQGKAWNVLRTGLGSILGRNKSFMPTQVQNTWDGIKNTYNAVQPSTTTQTTQAAQKPTRQPGDNALKAADAAFVAASEK